VISRFIEIANYCSKLNNFQSLKTIVYGLEKTYVKELQPVWEVILNEIEIFLNKYTELKGFVC
jgi:RNAse (barnase) inhibitor barstar